MLDDTLIPPDEGAGQAQSSTKLDAMEVDDDNRPTIESELAALDGGHRDGWDGMKRKKLWRLCVISRNDGDPPLDPVWTKKELAEYLRVSPETKMSYIYHSFRSQTLIITQGQASRARLNTSQVKLSQRRTPIRPHWTRGAGRLCKSTVEKGAQKLEKGEEDQVIRTLSPNNR